MPVAAPFIMRKPFITVNSLDLVCHARKVSLVPEDSMADVETFCNPGGEAPGSTKWMLTISALQSYGAGATPGLWDTLRPLAKTQQALVLRPDVAIVGATNPSATLLVWVPSIPFVDSEIGQSTTMDIDFPVIGEPVFAIV